MNNNTKEQERETLNEILDTKDPHEIFCLLDDLFLGADDDPDCSIQDAAADWQECKNDLSHDELTQWLLDDFMDFFFIEDRQRYDALKKQIQEMSPAE